MSLFRWTSRRAFGAFALDEPAVDLVELVRLVHPPGLGGIGERYEADLAAVRCGGGEGVRQVELALGVGGREPPEVAEGLRRRESVDPRVDAADGELLRRRVRRLDDPGE